MTSYHYCQSKSNPKSFGQSFRAVETLENLYTGPKLLGQSQWNNVLLVNKKDGSKQFFPCTNSNVCICLLVRFFSLGQLLMYATMTTTDQRSTGKFQGSFKVTSGARYWSDIHQTLCTGSARRIYPKLVRKEIPRLTSVVVLRNI